VGGEEVGVSSTEAFQRVAEPAIQVELPTTLAMASNPDPGVGRSVGRLKTNLDTAVGEGARSLVLLVAKSFLAFMLYFMKLVTSNHTLMVLSAMFHSWCIKSMLWDSINAFV
jgi:hypothetical protein